MVALFATCTEFPGVLCAGGSQDLTSGAGFRLCASSGAPQLGERNSGYQVKSMLGEHCGPRNQKSRSSDSLVV